MNILYSESKELPTAAYMDSYQTKSIMISQMGNYPFYFTIQNGEVIYMGWNPKPSQKEKSKI